jgi:hypothetical protein
MGCRYLEPLLGTPHTASTTTTRKV